MAKKRKVGRPRSIQTAQLRASKKSATMLRKIAKNLDISLRQAIDYAVEQYCEYPVVPADRYNAGEI